MSVQSQGNHMITIGKAELHNMDCMTVMQGMESGSLDAIICDLPYGTTQNKWDVVIPFEPLWEHYKRVIKPNGAIVLTSGQPFASALVMSNPAWFKYELIWEKTMSTGFLDCSYRPLRSHESILVFYNEKPTYNPQKTKGDPWVKLRSERKSSCWGKEKENEGENESGDRHPKSVILIANPNNGSQHPTQKPTPLMEYLIRTYTNEGETVMDNTMGSGTTGVACMNTGRNFIGIEKDAGYFEIACKRIEQATAQQRMFA